MVRYDRGQLLQQVWAAPLSVVAPAYGLSDVGLKKLCARLQVPTPTRGHWAKCRAGKAVPAMPALPDYSGPAHYLWRRPASAAESASAQRLVLEDPRWLAIVAYEQLPSHHIDVAPRLSHPHRYISQTQEALRRPVLDQRGMPAPGPHPPALNLQVSVALQPRALRVADALLKAFALREYPVHLGGRATEVEILGIRISLRWFEPARHVSRPTLSASAYVPSGQLQLLADSGYGGKVADTPSLGVEGQLNQLIISMARRAVERLRDQEARALKDAEQQQQRAALSAQKALQEAERARLRQLEVDADAWRRATELREYLDAFEQATLLRGGVNAEQLIYLQWARAKADWLDPLINRVDALLDLRMEPLSPNRG
jgi:hypothetical protein